MRTAAAVILAALSLSVASCGLLPSGDRGRVVDRYPDPPPSWLNDAFAVADGRLYAVGRALRVYDPTAKCIDMARSDARRIMVKHARALARDQFAAAVRGVKLSDEQAGGYLGDLAAMTGDNLIFHGNAPDDQYQERFMVGRMPHPDFYLNCEVRISLPMENYLRARAAALSKFKDSAQGDAAQAVAKAADAKFNPSGS